MGKDSGSYETFDSTGGPTVKGQEGSGAHRDSGSGLSAEGENAEHGDVPQVPQKKQ